MEPFLAEVRIIGSPRNSSGGGFMGGVWVGSADIDAAPAAPSHDGWIEIGSLQTSTNRSIGN